MFKKLFLTLIAIFVIGSAALAQNDTVQLENKSTKCKITNMTATELTVEDRGVEEVIPVNKIKNISFNREPAQFPKVRSLIESGSNEDALELLTPDVRGTIGNSPMLNQEMDYLIARVKANIALSGGAVSKTEAAKVCEAFVTKYPKSYHYFDACEMTGDLYVAINTEASLKKAADMYKNLNKAPWNDVKMRSLSAMGKIFLSQNNITNAQKAYQAILAMEDKSSAGERQKLLAKMGLAKCKALSGDYQGAVKDVESILQNAPPEDYAINALGYNTLGLAHMAGGQDKDALVDFLQVDLLYSRDVQSHIEALKNLRTLWKKLEMTQRATECTNKLKLYGIDD
ncbi:MAG: tetratricopeptide repeat protein [Thermoguttaceae bacterium]|nr:tetratricopeptide repeat protein [Thermoguttaceae bacterium]